MRAMRYPLAELAEVEDDIRDHILSVSEKSGYVPNAEFFLMGRLPWEKDR